MKYGILIISALILASCGTSGVEPAKKDKSLSRQPKQEEVLTAEMLLEPKKTIVEKKEFPNGLKIQWFEKGTGEALSEGEVYEVNFKVKLTNGEIVDGNHLLKKDMIPFLVGYGMQTKGWDIAMKEMHVGDFAEVFIPANLARGAVGVPGVIPPNSPNIIFLRVGKKIAPSRIVEGTKIWLLEERPENKDSIIGEKSDVAFHYFVGTKSNPKYDNSYKRKVPFEFNMDNFGLVPGLRKALLTAKTYDKLWILVPPSQAYGSKGYVDVVKPGESMFYDIIIMSVRN